MLAKIMGEPAKPWSYSQSCRDWPSPKPRLAIVLALPDQPNNSAGHQLLEQIWGVGIVRPGHQTDSDQEVILSRTRRLHERVDAPRDWVAAGNVERLPETGPITRNATAILTELTRLLGGEADVVEALTDLLDERPDWTERGLRWRDERDAVLLFAKIAGLTPNDIPSIKNWDRTSAGASFLSGVSGDAIQSAFDDILTQITTSLGNVGCLTARTLVNSTNPHRPRYHLELATVVSQSTVDSTSGSIDAYYFHTSTGTLVMLRYMRPAMFELPDACASLAALEKRTRHAMQHIGRDPHDFRLLEDPLFVRIHKYEPFTPAIPRTSSGAIYPIIQVLEAINGSISIPTGFSRHLVPTDFARLARDGWFGPRKLGLDAVLNLVIKSVDAVGHALLVVDQSTRPRGNGP
ncbi:hypothetical protein IU427_33060 [Nocardia beijingensis]|uniref:hypothetical protein n=1 Tax=Nocardia beijingensis TaxID=95162 RepID=UPI001893F1E0|nr:hypothetical protein [Nocardia beijingensis]MBF6469951.1 hypothetical protein [Nocardia beijingensis]